MKQRPRPLLACSECNNIYCQVCLETRFKTDKWAEGRDLPTWQCPKCAGDCCCKSCSKVRPRHLRVLLLLSHPLCQARPGLSGAARKRPALSASSDEEYSQREEDDGSLLFFAPARPAPAARRAVGSLEGLPGRQPGLPAGFQWGGGGSGASGATAAPAPAPTMKERALGIWDVSTPVHRKALELARQKEQCDTTIANMQGLLAMLQKVCQLLLFAPLSFLLSLRSAPWWTPL